MSIDSQNLPLEAHADNTMQRDFESREAMVVYLREQFPDAAGISGDVATITGGRKAAEAQMARLRISEYGGTRNYLDGAVTRLSPYIRYGVLSLGEVRDFALTRIRRKGEAYKFINELAWRDYWQRLYAQLGEGIWENREPLKAGFVESDYAETLPDDIRDGTTGRVCMDAFSHDLKATGYLHNHARMWMAAYIVHFRRVKWQTGAIFFLSHLLDGDPASNNLSWQWVASTFSHKPYFFNRENLERYTNGVYCKVCPLYGHCDFEGSYTDVAARIFPRAPQELAYEDAPQSASKNANDKGAKRGNKGGKTMDGRADIRGSRDGYDK